MTGSPGPSALKDPDTLDRGIGAVLGDGDRIIRVDDGNIAYPAVCDVAEPDAGISILVVMSGIGHSRKLDGQVLDADFFQAVGIMGENSGLPWQTYFGLEGLC